VLQLNRELAGMNRNLDRTVAERTAALQASEERFALAVRGSSDGLWDWNVLTDEVYYAPRFKELLGYVDEEFPNVFATFESHLHEEDRDATLVAVRKHLEERAPYDVEYRLRTKSGEYRWFRARGQAIWNESRQPMRMAGSITDIHDRKRAESALEHERFLLHTLLTNLPDAIYFKDVQGRFTRASRALAERLGARSPEELIGRTDADFFPEKYAARAREDEQAVMQSGTPLVGKEERPDWGGDEMWVSTTKVPLRDRDGRIVGTFGISHDITAVKQAESRFRRVVDAAPNPMLVVAADGTVQLVNAATERSFGYEREELIGQPVELLLPERFREGHRKLRENYFLVPTARAMDPDRELCARRSDGSEFLVEIGLSPITVDGQTVVLASVYDVTLRKEAEAALLSAKEAAEQANRAKSDFLANMSHEIRTPMNAIIGMTELLLDDDLSPAQREYARTVFESAESLLTIINEILDFSKIEAGHLELEPVDFDLREEIVDMLRTLGTRAHNKDVELVWQVDSDVPACVHGDPVRIRQVLLNLVGNAIKFTEQGEVAVNVELASQSGSTVDLQFSVCDTGIGIPREKLRQIFTAFTQADGSTTRRFGGTGLGLTISSRLVEAMGGRIKVESEEGVGSRFHFRVELKQARQSPAADVLSEWPDLRNLPALVIDDNETNRQVLRQMLESWGMQVRTVEGGREAINVLTQIVHRNGPLPLVLSDVNMPHMDGFTLVERLRSSVDLRDAVVILLTSGGRLGDGARSKELGISSQLMKPVRPSELLEAVMVAVGRQAPVETRMVDAPEQELPRLPALKILLAEDGKANQRLARALLEKWGHAVDVAGNGQIALDRWRSDSYDLILMDVQMPVLDGLEATRRIRALERSGDGHVPIVAMTARAMKGDRERCLAAGMDEYVAKPVRKQELYAAIAPFFDGHTEMEPDPSSVAGRHSEIVNWEAALRHVDGSEDILYEVAQDTLTEVPDLMRQLEQALENGRGVEAGRLAHTIKATGRMFAVQPLLEQTSRIETLAAAGDLESAGNVAAVLRVTVDAVVGELRMRVHDTAPRS
jgi:PAS domain S-box-containing protein